MTTLLILFFTWGSSAFAGHHHSSSEQSASRAVSASQETIRDADEILGAVNRCPTSEEQVRIEATRKLFCHGGEEVDSQDAYDAICSSAKHLDNGQKAREAEFYSVEKRQLAVIRGNSSDHLAYLHDVEQKIFESQPVRFENGRTGPITEEFLRSVLEEARGYVQGEAAKIDSPAANELAARLKAGELRLHSRISKDYSSQGNTEEFEAGEATCGPDGLSVNSYSTEEKNRVITLCPGTYLKVLSILHFFDHPVPERVLRLALLAKVGHELSHSIDSHQFAKAGAYQDFQYCLLNKYGYGSGLGGDDNDSLKELVPDHFGNHALGEGLVAAGDQLPIREKLRVIYANFAEVCSSDGWLDKLRLREAATDPGIRKALHCGNPPKRRCELKKDH